MISKTTRVVNNQFEVTFDFTPDNVYHSRTNSKGTYWATHPANGTTARQGIWEGIELVEVWTKVGNNAWRSHGKSYSVKVSTSYNNETIQAQARYRLRTMGHHWNDFSGTYPFFYFGNIGGNPNKYAKGYFTDSSPVSPGKEHQYCVVPPDWSYKWCEWSDWAYKHGSATKNWAVANGRYEQRNANYEAASANNGWISDSGNKQMWRKSMMFFFEKDYWDSTVSSGIATHPNTPGIEVHWAKGDTGKITVKYSDNAGHSGQLWINAYCKEKTAWVRTYDNSGTFYNGQSLTIDVDFNSLFGESYRGNDVYYEVWSRNNLGYECKASTGWKGVQRYNGRPSRPNSIWVEGVNGIIYDKVKISWGPAWDPDGDWLVYHLYAKIVSSSGQLLKEDYIAWNINGNSYEYDISNYPENSMFYFWAMGSDGQIIGDWTADAAYCQKGAKPKGRPYLIAPNISGTTLYNKRPRFFFEGYDGQSDFIVVINGIEYSKSYNTNLFYQKGNRVVFQPDWDLDYDTYCCAYMRNQYGKGEYSSTYNFKIYHPYDDVVEGNIITAKVIKEIQWLVYNFGKAYNWDFKYTNFSPGDPVTANIYNECHRFLNDLAWTINNLMDGLPFKNYPICPFVEPGQVYDDALWHRIVEDLKII